jgi:Cu+-exporting ATPase
LEPKREVETPKAPPKAIDERIYTCPMHPEVRQKGPGQCPKCGMDLEPATASLEEEPESDPMWRRFWVSAVLTVPLFAIAMSEMIPGQPLQEAI